ncbi:MAG: lipoate--protein ligase [Deltaproteobacteria bacterium]|nr:lipoate--protein ligase [Deltaproteobacteria bacterium]
MRCILNPSISPPFNLAAEEWLLRNSPEHIFMLWRNAPAVIVGRHQHTDAEIDRDFVRKRGIAVIRRITGGGAVFHDLGNVNFSFVRLGHGTGGLDFARFTAPVLEALRAMGVGCGFDGRNDLVFADGRKFSGNAQHIERGRVLHHGTLLFDSRLEDMAGALRPDPSKFVGKAVRSVPARVGTLKEHLPHMDVEEFMRRLFAHMLRTLPGTRRDVSSEEEEAVTALARARYENQEWNFGASPAYGFTRRTRIPAGTFDVSLDVQRGIIRAACIRGDFFALRPVEELEALLHGCPHEYNALATRLEAAGPDGYIQRLDTEAFLSCLV